MTAENWSYVGLALASGHMTFADAAAHIEFHTRRIASEEIEQFADDHSDVSDAYRHAAMIAKGIPGA